MQSAKLGSTPLVHQRDHAGKSRSKWHSRSLKQIKFGLACGSNDGAPLGPNNKPCSGNQAEGGVDKGICSCRTEFAGEDCSALQIDETHALCSSEDQTYSICRYLKDNHGGCIIAVAPYGDDTGGKIAAKEANGWDTMLVKPTLTGSGWTYASKSMKAFQTITAAIEIATSNAGKANDPSDKGQDYMRKCVDDGYVPIILVYPGLGSDENGVQRVGAFDCDMKVDASNNDNNIRIARDIAIISVTGSESTVFDCNGKSRGVTVIGTGNAAIPSSLLIRGFNIKNGRVEDDQKGGALKLSKQADVTLEQCIIENNIADEEAGAIYVENSRLQMKETIVRNNTAKFGGGVFAKGRIPNLCVTDINTKKPTCQFTGDTCSKEVQCPLSWTVRMDTVSTIQNNRAIVGGGVYLNGAALYGGILSGNQAVDDRGSTEITGAGSGGNLAAEDSDGLWKGKDSSEWDGESGRMSNKRTSIVGTIIENGVAENDGGGIYITCKRESSLQSTLISQCQDIVLRQVTLRSGTAGQHGGGMFVRRSSVILDTVTIESNTADSSGGGVALEGDCVVATTATTISNNIARISGGGILIKDGTTYVSGGGIEMKHGTFSKQSGYEGRSFFSAWIPLNEEKHWAKTLERGDLGYLVISDNKVEHILGNSTGTGGGIHIHNALLKSGQIQQADRLLPIYFLLYLH